MGLRRRCHPDKISKRQLRFGKAHKICLHFKLDILGNPKPAVFENVAPFHPEIKPVNQTGCGK